MLTPRITDHALLRWMERVHGVDVEAWRSLMRDEVRGALDVAGRTRAGCGPAFILSEDGGHVVTFIAAGQQVSPFRTGIGIARSVETESISERVEEGVE